MSASQAGIDPSTPMGANLVPGGATVRVWAPGARQLYVAWGGAGSWQPGPADELVKSPAANNHWTGFFPGVADGDKYRFFVVGEKLGPPRFLVTLSDGGHACAGCGSRCPCWR